MMSGWSGAAISRRSRSLCASQNWGSQISRRSRRRCQSSKRPEQPTSSPMIQAQRSYTTSRDLTEPEDAWRLLKGYLQTLRDELTLDEAAQLAAQLPLVLRGAFYEGFDPSRQPTRW